MEIFSVRLKWARERHGFTQKDMSEKLSMSQQGYGKIELNQREPNLDTLALISTLLGESVDFFLGLTELSWFARNQYQRFQSSYTRYLNYQSQLNDELKTPEDEEFTELRKEYLKKGIVRNHKMMLDRHAEAMSVIREIPCVKEETIEKAILYLNLW